MWLDEFWSYLNGKLVIVDGFLVDSIIVKDIRVAEDNLIIFGVFEHHIPVPLNSSLIFGIGQAAKRKRIVRIALDPLLLPFFLVPTIRIPLIVTNLFLIVAQSIYIVIFLRRALDDPLVDLYRFEVLLEREELVGCLFCEFEVLFGESRGCEFFDVFWVGNALDVELHILLLKN